MAPPNFLKKRLQDLADNIDKDLALLKDYEDALRYETNPRVIAGYRQEISRQKESINRYHRELTELQQKLLDSPSAQPQVKKVENQLQQMDAKLNILLSGQVAIYEDLNQMRQALLNRYEAGEQAIVSSIAQQLNQTQLVLTQNLLDALGANQVSEPEMQQMLAVLEERIPALPPTQAAIIKNPELDTKHKLKITLPIIPMLVGYEGELELGSGFNIQSVWEQLITKLRRK